MPVATKARGSGFTVDSGCRINLCHGIAAIEPLLQISPEPKPGANPSAYSGIGRNDVVCPRWFVRIGAPLQGKRIEGNSLGSVPGLES